MKRKLPTYKMPFKRRREGKTNYDRRLKLLVSKQPRFVVRKSLNHIRAEIMEFGTKGDITLVSATSQELKKLGWDFSTDSTPAAYLVGALVGRKAKERKVKSAILDMGLYPSTKGSRIYAAVKGVLDAGIDIPADAEMFPSEDRLHGKHMAQFNQKFEHLPENFKVVKQKILGA